MGGDAKKIAEPSNSTDISFVHTDNLKKVLLFFLGNIPRKFLKMHLKLDHLMTKNTNGIAIQIYATLIAYLILQLVEIPQVWGNKLLDKLRYLQPCMCQEISYVHWMESIFSS